MVQIALRVVFNRKKRDGQDPDWIIPRQVKTRMRRRRLAGGDEARGDRRERVRDERDSGSPRCTSGTCSVGNEELNASN